MKNLTLLLLGLFLSRTGYAETLIVGLSQQGNPPLTFAKEQSQRGIYCEILTAIGKMTDLTFNYIYLPPKRLLYSFEHGDVQVEPGINPAWRTHSKLPGVYTVAFGVNENIVLFSKGKRIEVRSPMDLLTRHVGTMRGYTYPGYMALFANNRIIREEGDSEYNLLSRMASGRFEQIFIQKDVAYYWMREEPAFAQFEVGNVNFKDPIMFRLHPSKKHLLEPINQAITTLIKNGTIDAIYSKYR